METNCKIRTAVLSDADTIFSFISHLEESSFDLPAFRQRFSDNLDNPLLIYLVAVDDADEVVGFISCHGQSLLHHEASVYEIQEHYVARNWRDKGIGRTLTEALEEKLEKTDCESLEVTTCVKRTDARKFYTKRGFVQTHIKFVKTF